MKCEAPSWFREASFSKPSVTFRFREATARSRAVPSGEPNGPRTIAKGPLRVVEPTFSNEKGPSRRKIAPSRNEDARCPGRRHVLECESDVHDSHRDVFREKGRFTRPGKALSRITEVLHEFQRNLERKKDDDQFREARFHPGRARRCSESEVHDSHPASSEQNGTFIHEKHVQRERRQNQDDYSDQSDSQGYGFTQHAPVPTHQRWQRQACVEAPGRRFFARPPLRPIAAMWLRSRLIISPPFCPALRPSSLVNSCARLARAPPCRPDSRWRAGCHGPWQRIPGASRSSSWPSAIQVPCPAQCLRFSLSRPARSGDFPHAPGKISGHR